MKLTTTNLAASAAAVSALPAALATYRTRLEIAAGTLNVPDGADLEAVRESLATHSAHADRVSRARDVIALLLSDAGVPVRTIAGAMGAHHATVTAMVTRARGERDGAAAEAEQVD